MILGIRNEQGLVVVELEGKIYVDDASDLREKLLEQIKLGHKEFLVLMERVIYIDSSGLGVLVAIQKRALEQGGRGVMIRGLNGAVREIFELTRLNRVFEIL